jgi:hypothetical protein
VLDSLRIISEDLSKRYGWDKGQSTLFVLTGDTPLVSPIKGKVNMKSPLAALSRITLTIDPIVSPQEVEEYYRKVRGTRRRRAMTEKHLKLAIFSTTRPQHETWEQAMQEWNKECIEGNREPSWSYMTANTRNFRRDCLQAQARLLQNHDLW